MGINERLKMLMAHFNLSPANFAEQIGVAPATISHILSGRNKYPSVEVLLRLRQCFADIDLNWLLTGEGEMMGSAGGTGFGGTLFDEIEENRPEVQPGAEKAKEMASEVPSGDQFAAVRQEVRYVEKPARKIVEIRIFFSDNTYETFAPQ